MVEALARFPSPPVRDRRIGQLVFLATLGCLMVALGDSFATLIGAALLLFIFMLSFRLPPVAPKPPLVAR